MNKSRLNEIEEKHLAEFEEKKSSNSSIYKIQQHKKIKKNPKNQQQVRFQLVKDLAMQNYSKY